MKNTYQGTFFHLFLLSILFQKTHLLLQLKWLNMTTKAIQSSTQPMCLDREHEKKQKLLLVVLPFIEYFSINVTYKLHISPYFTFPIFVTWSDSSNESESFLIKFSLVFSLRTPIGKHVASLFWRPIYF